VSGSVHYKRMVACRSIQPDDYVALLQRMVGEYPLDVDESLLRAMSYRFYESAEEFFPPQIQQVLTLFRDLSYADECVLGGLVGRLDDMLMRPSPRRMYELMDAYADLHISHPLALQPVLDRVSDRMQEFTKELPRLLASMATLQTHDRLLVDGLATQAYLQRDYIRDNFIWAFEAFSRHGYTHGDIEPAFKQLVTQPRKRWSLGEKVGLLAGCVRIGDQEGADKMRSELLSDVSGDSAKQSLLLEYMKRLRLRDAGLVRMCEEGLEMSLQSLDAVRGHLAHDIHALAMLIPTQPTLLAVAMTSPMLVQSLARLDAKKLTLLLHAACCMLVHATSQQQGATEALGMDSHSAMWAGLLTGIERGWRQLDLTHRRMLLAAIIYLQDQTAVQTEAVLPAEAVSFMRSFRHAGVPPLPPSSPSDFTFRHAEPQTLAGVSVLRFPDRYSPPAAAAAAAAARADGEDWFDKAIYDALTRTTENGGAPSGQLPSFVFGGVDDCLVGDVRGTTDGNCVYLDGDARERKLLVGPWKQLEMAAVGCEGRHGAAGDNDVRVCVLATLPGSNVKEDKGLRVVGVCGDCPDRQTNGQADRQADRQTRQAVSD